MKNQIIERFSSYLEFGTAGLRGKIGIGSSFLNEYTVKLATSAVAEYVLSTKAKKSNRNCGIRYTQILKAVCKVYQQNFIKQRNKRVFGEGSGTISFCFLLSK